MRSDRLCPLARLFDTPPRRQGAGPDSRNLTTYGPGSTRYQSGTGNRDLCHSTVNIKKRQILAVFLYSSLTDSVLEGSDMICFGCASETLCHHGRKVPHQGEKAL